jgi:hypothetical protein
MFLRLFLNENCYLSRHKIPDHSVFRIINILLFGFPNAWFSIVFNDLHLLRACGEGLALMRSQIKDNQCRPWQNMSQDLIVAINM